MHSTDSQITNLDGLFHVLLNRSEKAAPSNVLIQTTMWRINRMRPARALRTLFRQPNTIPPNAGIDIERYITFDTSGGSTYHLPTTDCSNMFVYQAIGSRVIHLQPTNECAHQCRLVTVKLEQNYTCKCCAVSFVPYAMKFNIYISLPLNGLSFSLFIHSFLIFSIL